LQIQREKARKKYAFMSDKVMIVSTPDQHFAEIGKSLVLQAPLENREVFTKRKSKLIIHQKRIK
jgi:hypothetical protein